MKPNDLVGPVRGADAPDGMKYISVSDSDDGIFCRGFESETKALNAGTNVLVFMNCLSIKILV